MGRVITQRRTRGEWELLVATHRSLFPDADFQAFRRGGPATNDSGAGAASDGRRASRISRACSRSARRSGRRGRRRCVRRISRARGCSAGTEPGRGAFYGRRHGHARRRRRRVRHAGDLSLRGRRSQWCSAPESRSCTPAIQWRGRSTDPALRARDTVGLREVMFVEPGWEEMSGRWFTGGYDETRHGRLAQEARDEPGRRPASRRARCASARAAQDVTIFGANLPRHARGDRDRLRTGRHGGERRPRDAGLDHGARERRFDGGGRQTRSVRRRRVAARRRGRLQPDQPHQGHAARRAGARRRRRVPETAPAVRRDRVLQRPRRQAGHRRRPRDRPQSTPRGASRSTASPTTTTT